MSTSASSQTAWRATLAGFCASLVGIGIARFAYTPLLPTIVGAHWFPASSAAYLGAGDMRRRARRAAWKRRLARAIP